MRNFILVCLAALLLNACVSAPKISSTFDPAEAAFIDKAGTGRISGQAFLRRNDGIVVYAAGSDVILIPRTTYATERMNALYGGGKINSLVPEPETDPRYVSMTKKTRADGEGRFEFHGLADGEYYIVTRVVWVVGGYTQGGGLMETANIRNGEAVDIIMTGQ